MKILVCFDGSEQSYQAVKSANEMALAYNAEEVTLVHVYPAKEASIWQAANESSGRIARELSAHEKQELDKYLAITNLMSKAVSEFENRDTKVSKKILKGNPVQEITELAEKEGYDIIVMGSRGYGGVKKLMLGSVSNGVIQESKVNVLVVK